MNYALGLRLLAGTFIAASVLYGIVCLIAGPVDRLICRHPRWSIMTIMIVAAVVVFWLGARPQ